MSKVLFREIRQQHDEEHALLEDAIQHVLGAAEAEDPRSLQAAWTALERRLGSHLDVEERCLFPLVEYRRAGEVQSLREEHARIRALVSEIGLACDLHSVRKGALETLAALFAEHTRREDEALARWLDESAPLETRRALPRLFVEMMRAELRAG
jgi:hemerythrin